MRLIVLLYLLVFCLIWQIVNASKFNLTILHNNDIHSHFIATNNFGEDCDDQNAVGCYGGVARIIYEVRKLKKQFQNVLYLNAGDNFTGTLWYKVFGWRLWANVVKNMLIDAMSFGNHEFDDGVKGVSEYVRNISTDVPTLACNVDVSKEPRLRGFVKKSIVFAMGRNIGVIGYVLPETSDISHPGSTIKFSNEIQCIREEAEKMKKKGINIIIAVGHSGFKMDKQIARQIPDVDIVVGGHTNTFLYTGKPPSDEEPSDVYPVVINHSDGRTSLVVQAYAFGKYLGVLHTVFDDNGDIKDYSGQPILLDHTIPNYNPMLNFLLPMYETIKRKFNETIGYTAVFLDGNCRNRECNLGNMIADAMISYVLKHENICKKIGCSKRWTDYPLAFLPSGSVRASINVAANGGEILSKDAMRVFPFDNSISGVSITGKVLKEVFEHSVSRYDPNDKDPEGEFLQISGIHVKYDPSMPAGNRVVSVEVRCGKCLIPKFEPLDENKVYNVITTDYIARGGDMYTMLKTVTPVHFDKLLRDVLTQYIETNSPIFTGLERRSEFINRSEIDGCIKE